MTPEWSHLLNAKYIDLILADVTANPSNWTITVEWANNWDDAWANAWYLVFEAAYAAKRDHAWTAARDSAWTITMTAASIVARDSPWISTNDASYTAVSGAILALIAHDDCAYLLDAKPEYVQMIALLGNPAAVLLYPACIAMNSVAP
jgi:hypothetical protein